MDSHSQIKYQVTRSGEVIGSFTAEQLSRAIKNCNLLVTDHYHRTGWPDPRPLAEIFPPNRQRIFKICVANRNWSIAIASILGLGLLSFGVLAITQRAQNIASLELQNADSSDQVQLISNPSPEGLPVTNFLSTEAPSSPRNPGKIRPTTERANSSWSSQANDAYGDFILGVLYRDGYGEHFRQDFQKAIEHLTSAANQGLVDAQIALGRMYGDGNGVPGNTIEAVKWFAKAANQGNSKCQYIVGFAHESGIGVAKDLTIAIDWYQKAATQDHAEACFRLGQLHHRGDDIPQNLATAASWYKKAANQGCSEAQFRLAVMIFMGSGVSKNPAKSVEWFTKAAEQGDARAQFTLGGMFSKGEWVSKDTAKAVEWFIKAAEQGYASAQGALGGMFATGDGVAKDLVRAHVWCNLAHAANNKPAGDILRLIEKVMTSAQIDEAKRIASNFKPRKAIAVATTLTLPMITDSRPVGLGTGFFITFDGYAVTNQHVIEGSSQIRLRTGGGIKAAKIVRADKANDLALLKADGVFSVLPIVPSRDIALGNTVATVGFPNIELMGFSPKLAKGDIASLAGIQDDPRFFQISVPVQPGNSGGALVDEAGNVIGVVSGKLSAEAALALSGALPENVNYAVKSSFLLSFLESVPELKGKLREPHTDSRKFDEVVKEVEQATALVLVY